MEERLQKILSAHGLCSRRAAETWLAAGRVTFTLNGNEIGQLSLLYDTGVANNTAPLRWWQRLFG